MRKLTLFLLGCAIALSSLPAAQVQAQDAEDDDTLFTLVLLQMVTQKDDPNAMRSLYPLLLTSILGNKDGATDDKSLYYLLLGVGNDASLQQWLPLILNNKKTGTADKLLMMMFMQQSQLNNPGGQASMQSLFPLLLLNADDDRQCSIGTDTCFCDDKSSNLPLYIMMMNGQLSQQNPHNMFLYMMMNKDSCDGKLASDNSRCKCEEPEGTDMLTYMMMFMMNPEPLENNLPPAPPQRSVDVKSVLKQQLLAGLGPEYSWMSQIEDTNTKDLARFQLYQQMGIPPNVMSLMHNNKKETSTDERFALIQWMSQSQGGSMDIETMSLMLGIEDSKQFYIHGMIEQGQVDPMTASLLLASMGSISKDKLKELLIMAATGQIDPQTFATINKPYVPELPQGVYPGQDLFFIHLELLDINTCSLIEPSKRKACGEKQFGAYITAEQCEVHPYCCYNPYFGDDTRVVSTTGEEENVPWCYYNIFFVFHDQYKLRVRKADEFKGPQDCPGLFRYGLNLDPYIYFEAVEKLKGTSGGFKFGLIDGEQHGFVGKDVEKMAKLIHYRNDVGFPGITEFHCRAILGACWDNNAAMYPAQYKIPQCYTELKIHGDTDAGQLNLYDPELFKPEVPEKFRSTPGECDTNYFHISTLYYERRACTYTVDMIKYGSEFSPLNEPTREDCLFRLGCCYEDNAAVVAQYPFMPRCYHRTRSQDVEQKEQKLYDNKVVIDAFSPSYPGNVITPERQGDAVCEKEHITQFVTNLVRKIYGDLSQGVLDAKLNQVWTSTKEVALDLETTANGDDGSWTGYCLYAKTNAYGQIYDLTEAVADATNSETTGLWAVFDIFNKQQLTEDIKEDNVPQELKSLKLDLF